MPETAIATIDPQVAQELKVVIQAIEVSLSVREITVDFVDRRDRLITEARAFDKPPTNDEEQTIILAAQRGLQGLRKEVEKQAAALKSPLNEARKKIIAIEDGAVELIQKEEKRLQGLVNNFQQKLLQARQDAEREAQRQRDEIARQAQEAEQKQQEAERLRAVAARAGEDKKRELEQKAQELDAEAYAAMLEAETATPAEPISVPAPQAREVFDFTLKGRNEFEKGKSLEALYKQHPELFAVHVKEEGAREFTIKLKIKDLLDALEGKPPFAKITDAHGINIITRLSTLR